MSAVFGRHSLLFGLLGCALFAAAPARADTVSINLDQARLLKIPDRVTTIVIGNPLIADAALQSGGLLVVTGKGYGATNLLALDRDGKVVMGKTVQVAAPPATIWSWFTGASSAKLIAARRNVSRASRSATGTTYFSARSARPAPATARRKAAAPASVWRTAGALTARRDTVSRRLTASTAFFAFRPQQFKNAILL